MLELLIDIRLWLREDRTTPFEERLERDHKIGKGLAGRSDVNRVLEWWRNVGSAPVSDAGRRARRAQRLAGTVLTGAGCVLGLGAGGVAFAYDGNYPVNLFTLLGVLVVLPLLLLLASLLLLPGRIPGLSSVQGVLAGINPGRWLGVWLDESLGVDSFAATYTQQRGASAFSRWQLLTFSQLFAAGFFSAILVLGLILVTFTDLAFGWTTTLEFDPANVHEVFATLAWPWRNWLPTAVPDLALVEVSRYFRLDDGAMDAALVARLGGWWPFVLATLAFYGLLPRVIMLILCRWRLTVAARALLREDSEVTALLDRLASPLVSLEGDPGEAAESPLKPLAAPKVRWLADSVTSIVWNDALSPEAADCWTDGALGGRVQVKLELGVNVSQDEFKNILAELPAGTGRVLLFTKGWEPPLLEFADFLELVRHTAGSDCAIAVVPIDVSGKRIVTEDRDVWAAALAHLGDSRLYVFQASE